MRTILIVLLLSAIIIGCKDNGSAPSTNLAAQTERTTYTVGERIGIVISNSGSDVAKFSSCCTDLAYYSDRLENGIWRMFRAHGLPCEAMCIGIEIVIGTGERRCNGFAPNQTGTYRLRIPTTSSNPNAPTLELVTNTFTVQ